MIFVYHAVILLGRTTVSFLWLFLFFFFLLNLCFYSILFYVELQDKSTAKSDSSEDSSDESDEEPKEKKLKVSFLRC